MKGLDPVMEAALLKETESALREFTQAAVNCGMSKGQMALMLRARADELAPPLEIEHATVQ